MGPRPGTVVAMTPLLHIDGRIERRLLVNLRLDPDAVRRILPSGLRPQIVDRWAVAGLCCIRLAALPPGTTAEWDSAFVMRSVSCAWRGSTTHTATHSGVPVLAPR